MTQVSRSAETRAPAMRTVARAPEPAPGDVRAMKDALAAARGRTGPPEQLGPRGSKAGALLKEASAKGEATATPEQPATGDRAVAALDPRQEEREQFEGFGQPGQPNASAPQSMPTMPSPQAHPGAFAQMLADLWTRENGKGSKDVSVRFGERAWPATGARLVRNAAGTLDVTLYVGDRGQRYGGDLSGLAGALGEAGVDLGSLELEAA